MPVAPTVNRRLGGGVAIVLVFLAALVWMLSAGSISGGWGAMLGAGSGVALLGFLDDHGHIAARWRLLGHFSAAIWILLWTGGFRRWMWLGMLST